MISVILWSIAETVIYLPIFQLLAQGNNTLDSILEVVSES